MKEKRIDDQLKRKELRQTWTTKDDVIKKKNERKRKGKHHCFMLVLTEEKCIIGVSHYSNVNAMQYYREMKFHINFPFRVHTKFLKQDKFKINIFIYSIQF